MTLLLPKDSHILFMEGSLLVSSCHHLCFLHTALIVSQLCKACSLSFLDCPVLRAAGVHKHQTKVVFDPRCVQTVRHKLQLFAQKPKAQQLAALQLALTCTEKAVCYLCGCLAGAKSNSSPFISIRFSHN